MSELTHKLRMQAGYHDGTETAQLLRWAALHIEAQDEALAELREEHESEERERIRLEEALHVSKASVEQALKTLQAAWCPPVDLAKDLAPHINLMALHGDPDYLKSNGNSIRHVDCRETAPRKARSTK
jgi:hypothetical protein